MRNTDVIAYLKLCLVYHSSSTMLELQLNRTENEKKPSTALYFNSRFCFLYPKSSKAFPAIGSGKKFVGIQVSRVDLQKFMLSLGGAVATWVSKQPWCTRVEILSNHVL